MKKLNVGIFGAGRIGQIHANNLSRNPIINIKRIVDPMADKLGEFEKQIGIKIETDPQVIFDDEEIEAVLICTPTDTHVDYIIKSAKAGKHIFCEKPVSLSDEESMRAYKAVKEAGVKFQIGVNRRYDRNFAYVKKMVDEGKVGKLELLRVDSRDPEPPSLDYVKSSGGLFMDMMIHDFDMARYISNQEITEVYVNADAIVNKDIKDIDVDTAIVNLKFSDGAIGVILNSRRAEYGYDQRLEAFGSKGTAMVENDLDANVIYADKDGYHTPNPQYFFLERYTQSYIDEVNDFAQAVFEDRQTSVTFDDAIMAQRCAIAAKESLDTKKPVKVRMID
ncbi:MAG: inositol 2-dehydrogenase [Peptoniphilaceae bacterium]|nr:inositol 2-dehydrogenase [Peptoniphilaceae bacterium]MDY6018367.1 inositol 2-dehydrogenase [Anaerococcus sp.]